LAALQSVSKIFLDKILFKFVKNANITIIKLMAGRLTAHKNKKAISDSECCDNNYIRFRLDGASVPLVTFYDRWARLWIYYAFPYPHGTPLKELCK